MKNILILSTSLRNNSNSEALAKSFMEGAKINNNVEFVSLKDKHIAFCKGCMACQKIGKCVIKDDAIEIADKMCASDIIVWATPIYYYEMSGQMKTMIDRANSLYSRDYKFRETYLLATAADDDPNAINGALKGLNGWVDCFDKLKLAGFVFAGGVDDAGSIKDNPKLQEAYELGKSIK